ncbi:hypothetical protein [Bacillus cereus]|uniref:hypothetical protein n=1 Tax=Bacillus cereus TaxID=1396 RepID=UPI000BEDB6F5|nr:hypothetical protein [Bacillus cereus]PDY71454.1 hypothetical protein COM93_00455 [Bacillus cereus]
MAKLGDVLLQPETGWSRFDDTDKNIFYTGDWSVSTNNPGIFYNGSVHMKPYSKPGVFEVKFTFTGTGLRLIAQKTSVAEFKGLKTNVTIDGIDAGTFEMYDSSIISVYQSIIFEKLNLAPGIHTVTISTSALYFDAVDIQGGSLYISKVDTVLKDPEPGWARIDNTNKYITYIGETWTPRESLGYYNDTYTNRSASASGDGTVSLNFKGTGIRIIGPKYQSARPDINVQIDGVSYGSYRIWDEKVNGSKQQLVLHEVLGLEDKVHEIKLTGTTHMVVDAFDILGGTIVPKAKQGDLLPNPEPSWKRHKFNAKLSDGTVAIKYYPEGAWEPYKDTDKYTTTRDVGYLKFKFYGSAIRVISTHFNNSATNAKITIDGISSYYNFRGDSDGDRISVEKLGLPLGIHTVEIYANKSGNLSLSAIDLKDGEYFVSEINVGEQLLEPQLGWKRIDDTDNNIEYTGVWATSTADARYYNNTFHYKHATSNTPADSNPVSIKFNFSGTKLRIIGLSLSLYDANAKILIDGVEETINFFRPKDFPPIHKALIYEKTGLPNQLHTVEIKGEFINLDAIDIDESGSIGGKPPVKVGDQLLQPEDGWKRIDDTDVNIKYSGNWTLIDNLSDYHNSTARFKHAKQSSVDDSAMSATFKFKGTKLRVIGVSNNTYDREAQIIIDGKPETISFYANRDVSPTRVLLFDKQGLTDEIHTVELNGVFMHLDAIDIDENGSMIPPAKVGDVLLQPESRWTRFDDRHSLIKYGSGTWELATDSRYYDSTNTFSRVSCDIEFSFKGTGLRIVSKMITTTSGYGPVDVLIDGVTEKYSITGSSDQWQTLLYEKQGLPHAVHSVKLVAPNGIIMDAIDVLDGQLEKTSAKVGDQLLQPEDGWKRIDDTDANIKYLGNWKTTKESNNFNSTIHYNTTSGVQVSYQFEFSGSKLRIIGFGDAGYDKSAKITIDGITEDIVYYQSKSGSQIIVYEKLNLKPGTHTVKVEGSIISLDAIDIEDTGSMVKSPVEVGDILLQPEFGWDRLNNSDPSITYTKFIRNTDDNGIRKCYMNDYHYAPNEGTVNLEFTGTGFRVLGIVYRGYSSNISIEIDGVKATFSEDYPVVGSYLQGSTLVYEMTNLENKKHTVKIYNSDITKGLGFDAFDIKSGDTVKLPAKVGDILLEPDPGWKRIDDADTNIKYDGKWALYKGDEYYNSTLHYKYKTIGTDPASIRFNFYGTKLRIIGILAKDYDSNATITIDGKIETINFSATQPKNQAIVYEKLNLPLGDHSVKLDGIFMNLDAIDIDSDDSMVKPTAKVGDQLLAPEDGWKRYDDNASEILYDANWAKNVAYSGAYGGKSTSAHKGKNSSFRFKFKGTKFRLIVGCSTTEFYSDKISVRIDDLPLEFFNANAPKDTNQVLKYEKLGLEDKEHEVKVSVVTSQPGAASYDYRFDALDIDDTGSLIKINTVGDVLTEPEKGWKRIDDNDPLIRYIGNWKLATGNDKHYNKTTHYNLDKKLDTSFEFEFVGTKLRLLAYGDSGYDATSKILIDGKEETMVYNSPSGNQVIRYEKIGLDRGKHTVKVIGKAMSLDSIDIDADGYLLARLGDQLVEPEPGWVRFDDTHKNIEYNGFWKTTEGDVSCYNNTHHWKSKEDNNDSTISARFLFKGTKFRLISMTSPSYPEDIELKIDGQKEILKFSGEGMQYQTLAYEKKNLEDMIHVIELSGKYISIDAIDLEEGATLLKLPDEKLKPYQIRSGLILKDDFDTFDSRWIASPVGSYSLIDRKGYFRMLHNVSRDTLLLADLPNEKEFAFEVSADYTPTHEDDKGGIIVWKNGEENIEFLETEDGTRETTELKWMACKDNEDWTFFSDYGEGFNFYDSDRMNCSKFGVVLKKGSNSKFVNLDIDSIIATRGRKLTIANIAPNISVEMEDEFGRIIFNGNTGYNTGIQITLPSLEFAGKVILTNVEGKELGVIKNTFYGGDVYGFGSNLEIKFSGEELSTLAQTRLPDMISGKSEIMLELVNPSVARANNVNLSIAQYEDKFGWSWADLALDSNGKPGQYQDSINIPYVNPENTIKFWLKVTKGTDYVGLAPLQFQIHLEHE